MTKAEKIAEAQAAVDAAEVEVHKALGGPDKPAARAAWKAALRKLDALKAGDVADDKIEEPKGDKPKGDKPKG